MIIRIAAMIAHEFMEEYEKLKPKPPLIDESVAGFTTQIAETELDGAGFTAKVMRKNEPRASVERAKD